VKSPKLLRFTRARIQGVLGLRDARLTLSDAVCLDLNGAVIDGSLFCDCNFVAAGRVEMRESRIGQTLELSGGRFRSSGAVSVDAARSDIQGSVFARNGFDAQGSVVLAGADVKGFISFDAAWLTHAGGTALDLTNTTMADLFCRHGFHAEGSVLLTGASINGSAFFDGSTIEAPGALALVLDRTTVDGAVFLRSGFSAKGVVRFYSTSVGRQLSFDAGEFSHPGVVAIEADNLSIGGSLFFRAGAKVDGIMRLRGLRISDGLELNGAVIESTSAVSLSIRDSNIEGSAHLQPAKLTNSVDLRGTTVGVLFDNQIFRDARVRRNGLRYKTLLPELPEIPVSERLANLVADPDGYSAQPFSQLAQIYREKGHSEAARKVLIEDQKLRRRQRTGVVGVLARIWSAFLRYTIGYGYRPWLAITWIAVILTVGTWVVSRLQHLRPEDFQAMTGAPDFNPFLYTLDTFVPIIDFGFSKWVAHGMGQIVTVVLIASGWLLVTAAVAALASILRRGD
jgi:hypothetical protein